MSVTSKFVPIHKGCKTNPNYRQFSNEVQISHGNNTGNAVFSTVPNRGDVSKRNPTSPRPAATKHLLFFVRDLPAAAHIITQEPSPPRKPVNDDAVIVVQPVTRPV